MLLLFSSYAYCCDCNTIRGYNEAKVVFEGKVIKIEKVGGYDITFKVRSVQKGTVTTKAIVVNINCLEDECCGIDFKLHKRYKVFAFSDYSEKKLNTTQCSETHQMR